ncbi:MAG: hypothetical protein HY645_02735 [Acidobacteria bacterium]|nr:hypothetical protein [Acidobacteriota bacterium]
MTNIAKTTLQEGRILPAGFEDLEHFATQWAVARGEERVQQRLACSMEEISQFYQAVLPRMDSIMAYLDQYSGGVMPDSARHLLHLALSLVEVSRAVELYGRPSAEGLDQSRFVLTHEPEL